MRLIPSRTFTVVRQIGNHTDTGTYYVRAVVRNAYTDEILTTLDLDDKGSQRFKKDWLVPPETSGLGGFISIITSVYTDSGYTTKSENYADEENTYLWATLETGSGGGGFKGYTGPDTSDIRRVVREEIEKIPKVEIPPFPTPEKVELRWTDVLEAIKDVRSAIKEPQAVDMTPVLSAISQVEQAIASKEVTPPTDLAPLMEKIGALSEESKSHKEEMDGKHDDTYIKFGEMLMSLPKQIKEMLDNVEFKVSGALKTTEEKMEEPKEATNKVDISKMM